MNKYLLLIIISFFSLPDIALGYEIVVLKSSTSKITQQIQNIFIHELGKRIPHRGLKSIQPHQVTEIVITRGNEKVSTSIIQSTHPDLILALGAKALKVALLLPDIPIVHLLVINPEKIIDKTMPVTGVSLSVPPKMQLDEMKRYLPEVKRVGLIYDPKRSRKFIEQLDSARPDLEFIALAAENTAEVPELIHSLRGRVDLLWMLPDLTTTNHITIQSYVFFSIKNKIPLLTFSKKLLKHGATIAVTFDTEGIAKQAASLAMDMLFHRVGAEQATLVAPLVQTIANRKMAKKLGISIAEKREANE
ncbi:MAG: hypothetical protein D3924_04635 [Candidatus Electrothrix sp. AR4]|nr:hypothetical protein [Candidatus Electrothrix sp. AR4]